MCMHSAGSAFSEKGGNCIVVVTKEQLTPIQGFRIFATKKLQMYCCGPGHCSRYPLLFPNKEWSWVFALLQKPEIGPCYGKQSSREQHMEILWPLNGQ